MAFSNKGKRKITLGKDVFYWISDFRTDILRLTIMTEEKAHSRLICEFEYKDFWYYFKQFVEDQNIKTPNWNLSPKIVRQAIDYAILKGWKPFEKGKDFVLKDMENKIKIEESEVFSEITKNIISETRKMIIQNPKSKI
ncbi:MAG: hypothetical protein K1X72_12630 [Pyrinomonadaceae bacterium]|nr:hypothetical protein [Pyrinomonadaceae bacterium]